MELMVERRKFRGKVVKGLGEGEKYLEIPYYKEAFSRKFGFQPFPGTLNLRVEEDRWVLEHLKKHGSKVKGCEHEGRKLGAVYCCKGKTGELEVVVILPELTKHESTVELIAPQSLRKALQLSDGDEVWVEISCDKQ